LKGQTVLATLLSSLDELSSLNPLFLYQLQDLYLLDVTKQPLLPIA